VALKFALKNTEEGEDLKKEFRITQEIHKNPDMKERVVNVIEIFEVLESSLPYWTVMSMELALGSLESYLNSYEIKNTHMDPSIAKKIFIDLFRTVEILAKMKIEHGDLYPKNILLFADNHPEAKLDDFMPNGKFAHLEPKVKLANFGLAEEMERSPIAPNFLGQHDLQGLASILYRMFTVGEWKPKSEKELKKIVFENEVKKNIKDEGAKELIMGILDIKNPWNFEMISKHPWFK